LSQVAIREIDGRGRDVIPKEWRKGRLKSRKILMKLKNNFSIEIIPYNTLDLTKYFDCEVDAKSSLMEWHSLRKELRNKQNA
jgi:bifunctional DNA-binding transcriptional regulator/antitoxin component of YhaV-PrlF toxin-antitoxin module